MKVRTYEEITECVDVEVPDGLEGDELEAAIEDARCNTAAERNFCSVDDVYWETIEEPTEPCASKQRS